MLQLFRNNSPYTVIILFIAALLLKLQALIHPQLPVMLPGDFLYNSMLRGLNVVLNGHAFAYTFLGVIMLFLQSLYINRIAARHKLFFRPTYIPALTFLMLTSLYTPFSYFSEAQLINWCLIGGIDLLSGLGQTLHPRKSIFNAGFVLCLAVLIQFSALGYFLLLLLSLVILRPFNISEWIVAIVGYFTPLYFFFSILFLIDQLPVVHDWLHLGISLPSRIVSPVYSIGIFSGIILLLFGGLYVMQLQVPKSSIYVRRNWVALIVSFILSILVATITDITVGSIWLIAMPALSLIISHALLLEKSKRFSNFTFYFFLALVVFSQLALK